MLPGVRESEPPAASAAGADIAEDEAPEETRALSRAATRFAAWVGRVARPRGEWPLAETPERAAAAAGERVVKPPFDLRELAPEETRAIRRAGQRLVDQEVELWMALAKLVATASSGVRFK